MKPRLRKLHELSMDDVASVGGKAASLGELLRANHRVPPGFVVTAHAQSMSPELAMEIMRLYDELGLGRVAVRSSGVDEDAKDKSWAGQFTTFLHIGRGGLLKAIEACWRSAGNARVKAYGSTNKLAVLVQQMINSEVSGVAFSVNPVTHKQDEVMIEAVYGLCEPLVQGLATPDNYLLAKLDGSILEQDTAEKPSLLAYKNGKISEVPVAKAKQQQPALSPAQLREIARLVRQVEEYYGFPVDIEWAYQNDTLYLLQARPVTTL
jgi:phosphoenolpyruvate synthase/pyruvate phosphate dikinase